MDAIDDLSDALDATRELLTPIQWGLWLKLALVVFFVSSLGMGPTFPGGDVATFADEPAFESPEELEGVDGEEIPVEELLAALLVIGLVLFVLWALYAIIGAIMEFVFVETLRSEALHLRRFFRANLGNGLRLFGFRLGVLVVTGVLASVPGVALVATGDGLGDLAPGLAGLYALYGFGLFLAYSIVTRFTDEFVVPVMLLEDRSVLGGWRRFWGTLWGNWTEYVVYLVLVWILYIAVTIGVWFVIGLGAIALLIPFGIVIVVLALFGPIGQALALLVGLVALAAVLLFVALVWTPITTYFQYYALLVLGDTNEELDLIPEQRAAVRAEPGRGDRSAHDRADDEWADEGWDDDPASWDETADDADPWDDRTDRDDPDRREDRERRDDHDPWEDGDDDRDDDRDPWDDGDDDRDDDRSW